ncbi:sensor histidine kinase [Paenibacillus sp. GCM10012307]|uniref:Histidine kinase n=1 Tax=Paenibacillus roseus TaxID=2798579 RepID=A0A934MP73_9BACL|nr:histidine kinase [Paenibacillus roseus]MBJ6360129.1 histidine kinase [Paenibacillus roseus]
MKIVSLYRKWIGRFIFRKLNIGIGSALLVVFILLGVAIYNNFYLILEKKELELLTIRAEKLKIQFADIIERSKYDSLSLYQGGDNTMQNAVYEMFLPDNIPAADSREAVLQQNYIKNVILHMLSRNPYASAVLMYRVADSKLFMESQQQKHRIDLDFPVEAFFHSFPKSYKHPYFGSTDELLQPKQQVLYIANPIYNPLSIHPDKVYGYQLMALNTAAITKEFDAQSTDYRLIIKQDDRVLLDSRPDEPFDLHTTKDLISLHTINNSRIDIIGISYKSSLQSKLNNIMISILFTLGLSWIICLIIIHVIQRLIVGRFNQMSSHFKNVQRNPFTNLMPVQGEDEISDLIMRFNRMTLELQNHINQVYVAEIHKRNAEFVALKTQIHPHFLYNTLESLRMQALISDQPELANKIYHLGRLYRWMLQPTDDLISIQEELAHTNYYLELLMLGKSNRIKLRALTELSLENCFMLKFTLQPIIENAIQHGRLEQYDNPCITLEIRRQDELLVIEISNNGQPLTLEEHSRLTRQLQTANAFPDEHLGLKNIHERIKYYYGNGFGLSLPGIHQEEEPFRLLMIFPHKRQV